MHRYAGQIDVMHLAPSCAAAHMAPKIRPVLEKPSAAIERLYIVKQLVCIERFCVCSAGNEQSLFTIDAEALLSVQDVLLEASDWIKVVSELKVCRFERLYAYRRKPTLKTRCYKKRRFRGVTADLMD